MVSSPTALPVLFDGIPAEITDVSRWVLWRWEQRGGKWTKPPCQPDGTYAKSTDPSTWHDFATIRAAYHAGGFDGIGLVLCDDDDLVGIDLDHCVTDGVLDADSAQDVATIHSYAERSPSGDGVRIMLRATLPDGPRKHGNVEVYETVRYLTITGHRLPEAPTTVERRDVELSAWYARRLANAEQPERPAQSPLTTRSSERSDLEVLRLAFGATNGEAIRRLYHGDDSRHRDDTSAADLALCTHLAFYTQDPDQIDRILRGSTRMRPKWDERHFADGSTYGQGTIEKALAGLCDTYQRVPVPPLVNTPGELPSLRGLATRTQPQGSIGRLRLVRAGSVHARKVGFALGGRIPHGEITIICGIGGLGKSTMAGAWLAARASTGQLDGLAGARHVLISSAEDDRSATLVPRLLADGADLDRIDFIAPADAGARGLMLPNDAQELRSMVEQTGSKLVILDPIAAHLAHDVNADKDAQVRGALAPLSDVAHELGVIVIVVAHLNKLSSADLYQRLSGSSGFFNLARSVLLLTCDPEADEADPTARLLTHGKCNVGPEQPAVRVRIVPTQIVTDDGEPVETSRVEFGDEAPHLNATVALDPPTDEERSDQQRAADQLLPLLADGHWHDVNEVKLIQDRLKVSWKSMQRAANRLKVEKRETGRPQDGGVWQWRLVESARLPVDTAGIAPSTRPLLSLAASPAQDNNPAEDSRGHGRGAKSTTLDWTDCTTCGRRFFGSGQCRDCINQVSARAGT